jgi:hypothetical protein
VPMCESRRDPSVRTGIRDAPVCEKSPRSAKLAAALTKRDSSRPQADAFAGAQAEEKVGLLRSE